MHLFGLYADVFQEITDLRYPKIQKLNKLLYYLKLQFTFSDGALRFGNLAFGRGNTKV